MTEDRYSRQLLLPEIGPSGQKKLSKATAVVIGCGALGTMTLSFLARAGVGRIRMVDRDVVDLTNLQRQALFDESDVGKPKAKVSEDRLRRINSGIEVEGIAADVNHSNIEELIRGATVVFDATDNMDTRFLVNDACVKNRIPWVYAGAVGTSGLVLPIVPGGPCLRCLFHSPPEPGELPTCDSVGIINTVPALVTSLETTEGFKIILGKDVVPELLVIDVWAKEVQKVKVVRNPDCECCGKRSFEFLNAKRRKLAVSMCGRNSVQIVPTKPMRGGLSDLKKKLAKSGKVSVSEGVLRFKSKDADMTVFEDGRTIVSNTTDLSLAKTLFSKYVGD